MLELETRKGRVKWFNNEKGYGFIEIGAGVGEEGYKSLKEGDVVEFTLIDTSKGKQAIDVKQVKLTTV